METAAPPLAMHPGLRFACILNMHLNKANTNDNSQDCVYPVAGRVGCDYRQAEALSDLLIEKVILSPRQRPYWGHWGAPACSVQPLINGKRGTGHNSAPSRVGFRMDVFFRRWKMQTIGIDLALKATHKAVVADDRGTVITPVIRFRTEPEDLQTLMKPAREGKADDEPLRVVMEPTGLAWLPLASYFIQRGVTVHLVSTQQSADLRKFYSKHAKSARISARLSST